MKSELSIVFVALLFLNITAFTQSSIKDSLFSQDAIKNTLNIYNERLSDQSALYNGSQYIKQPYEFKEGIPYFLTSDFTGNSSVVYDKIEFDSINLLYEDLRQQLVFKSSKLELQLVNGRISSFYISGHHFIRLATDTLNSGIKEAGFYEVLYMGHCDLLKWTFKEIEEENSVTEGVVRHIRVTQKYFIKKESKYYRIKSKNDLMEVFRDHQKDMAYFIKKNHLKLSRDPENTLIQSVRYYDLIGR